MPIGCTVLACGPFSPCSSAKTLGRIDSISHRITGQHALHRARSIGHEHLHVAVDDASQLACAERLPQPGARLLRPGWAPEVERVMTDNGSAYRSRLLADAPREAQTHHIRTRPYTPRTNGKAGRFIQTPPRE